MTDLYPGASASSLGSVDTWCIDLHFQGRPRAVAAYLLADGEDLLLVETGPGSTLGALEAGVRAAGFTFEQLTGVVVTHIHLDHAGAAGAVLARAPRARLYVHPRGAPHLIDPSKLVASATRIYGADMDRLWGAFEPVPEARVEVLADGDVVRCGRRTLAALHTPGHAVHHVVLHEAERGDVYAGDVAGVRVAPVRLVRPPTPPPDIDLPAWRASVARIRALAPRRLLLTHFGAFDDVGWHLDDCLTRLYAWAGYVEGRLDAAGGVEAATPALLGEVGAALAARARREFVEAGADPGAAASAEAAMPMDTALPGIVRWLRVRDRAERA
ncbi:MBL fold hydrolase [Gemmatimonadetes bacterium T265]|nr:MBL fold hydrolase [Gemmatimonadetes bacterium T265]